MESNLTTGTSQLNCLLEKHKQLQERSAFKSVYQPQEADYNLRYVSTLGNYDFKNYPQDRLPVSATMNKVYVNPNYARTKSVIHINPHVQVKSNSIYVNPKVIHNIASSQSQEQISKIVQDQPTPVTNLPTKHSVHVNPKLMSKLISKVPKENQDGSQHSIPKVLNNPNKPTELSCDSNNISGITCVQNKPTKPISAIRRKSSNYSIPVQKKSPMNYIIKSKTKLVRNGIAYKKNPNSNMVVLSKRKVIRRSSRQFGTSVSPSKVQTPLKRRLSSAGLKKTKLSPTCSNANSVRNFNKYETSWNNKVYNNKNTLKISPKKKISPTKKSVNESISFVSIEGIRYKSSKNKLEQVSSNSPSIGATPLKRRRSFMSNKSEYAIKNDKNLLKEDSTKKRLITSPKLNVSTSPKNYKADISNKVKQRSLQIVRNKMRKNNQPCLIFQKFGYCANKVKGTCSKVHDKKQVALCKNFLQGKCFLENCLLSHNIGPEKMPTCKFFLEGCCTRDGCPYLHVKVSSKNPICIEFLRGYCPQGNECQKRHILACPDFDKTGECSKGKSCPYPHKRLTEIKKLKSHVRHRSAPIEKRAEPITPVTVKVNKRYYDEITEGELNQKKETLLDRVKILKKIHASTKSTCSDTLSIAFEASELFDDEDNSKSEEKREIEYVKSRRPPIGPLPSYIPIN